MKQLILFSLKRRFFNPVAISLQVLYLFGLVLLFNLDHISIALKLNLTQPYPITASTEVQAMLVQNELWEKQGLSLTAQETAISIDFMDGVYVVKGEMPLTLQVKIYGLLLKSHQQTILNQSHPSVSDFVMTYNSVPVNFETRIDPIAGFRENVVFMILTGIYFMMLNFISVNSNEIIQEKTSNILEFLLTSITPAQHFIAKIVSGLATVLIQIGLSLGFFIILLMQRLKYDQGIGLLELANKFFNLEASGITLETIQSFLIFDQNLIIKACLAFVFVILGLIIIQVLILVLSSRVKTIEEAASIQGPFYLGLLGLYYGSLMLNTPTQLSQGIGAFLSYVPVCSMLIMGMRILNTTTSVQVIGLSFLISLLSLTLVIWVGSFWYRRGLVNE
jgi:ABC-2 type transport system permease protein